MEERERARTGISSLKVRFNRVFGYYIEISKSNLHAVPARLPAQADDRRRRALHHAGAEGVRGEGARRRRAHPRARAGDLRALRAAGRRRGAAHPGHRARAGHARRARRPGRDRRRRQLHQAARARRRRVRRHRRPPPGRRALRRATRSCRTTSTSNGDDAAAGHPHRPEHGRQVDLPAADGAACRCWRRSARSCRRSDAKIPIVDRIFARVGASDNIARGQSTFMVEMQETANILHTATSRSLVVLDEIGRGTSTFDGLSIAWAVAEHLATNPRARPKTLFATHYHELTDLADAVPGVVNAHVAAREWKDDIIFLRKIVPGRSDRSYGIQVARLAGLPAPRHRARQGDPRRPRARRAVARRPADAVGSAGAPRPRSSASSRVARQRAPPVAMHRGGAAPAGARRRRARRRDRRSSCWRS